MFTKVKSIIANHAKQYDELKQTFMNQKKSIYQNPDSSMSYKDRQFAEAKEKYDADRILLIQNNRSEMDAAFNEIFDRLESAITAEIGQESIAELQMLMTAKVSEFEVNAYAKKFAGKYKALRLLKKIAENSGVVFNHVTDDDIVGDLNELKNMIIHFFNQYDGRLSDDYMARYILANSEDLITTGNRFEIIETEFNDFLNPYAGVTNNV